MGNCIIVVGLQWGDEGKGKVVDLLCSRAQWVVRFQGGANAGHTVWVGDEKVVLHLIPAGILHPHVKCGIGPSVAVDPQGFVEELGLLQNAGVDTRPDRLFLSPRACVVLPWHKELDKGRERAAGGAAVGTTGRGIGPAYEDMWGRRAVRVRDILDPSRLRAALWALFPEKQALLQRLDVVPTPPEQVFEGLSQAAEVIVPYVHEVAPLVERDLDNGRRVIFEGSQGALLDCLHGTYPYVTSSLTTASAVFPLMAIRPRKDALVMGVTKAYSTRVGNGPFPSEDNGELGERLRNVGREFGATTGRPRRCGALDLVLLRWAVRVNGVSALALTKLDVLDGLKSLKVCDGYELDDGGLVSEWSPSNLHGVVPRFREVMGFSRPVAGVVSADGLCAEALDYIKVIEQAVGARVALVSTGPARKDGVFLDESWTPS